MPISSKVTDYSGRKVDISILRTPQPTAVGSHPVSLAFGKNAQLCAGVQKLVQRYAIILLSNIGSQTEYPNFGTRFLLTLQQGLSPVDALRARQIFSLANYTASNIIKNYQITATDLPQDEQLDSSSLIDIVLYAGSASFSVQITTLAGDVIDFLIPLPE
jgi:hypothetical protein